MRLCKKVCVLIIFSITLWGCGSGGGTGPDNSGNDNGNNNDPEPVEYDLSVLKSPSDGGTVNPSSGTFEDNTEVTVEATANEGFSFREWTGDVSSENNPVTVTITGDTELTANFDDLRSVYTVQLFAISTEDTVNLRFGQSSRGSDGFDDEVDQEAPPPPPEGALSAYFEIDDLDLYKDFRNNIDRQAEWTLQYQVASGGDLKLDWEIVNDSKIEGDLVLTDESGSFEVDMRNETTHTVSESTSGSLLINYNLQ
ncbi:InlB B-repeat-containing protein [Fodinibius sp. SL11]|uniref:InlB B-repeat-containing protein n=1 Tax=Fodinibius sp. SL11 TaxID=3425690 RepID=UPI003F885B10